MDWVPLETSFWDDKKIQRIRHEFGLEGPAIYQFILCEVAEAIHIDNDRNGYLDTMGDHPAEYISWRLQIDREKAEEFLELAAKIELISPEIWQEKEEIFIPKILKEERAGGYLRQQKAGRKGGANSPKNQECRESENNGKQSKAPSDSLQANDKQNASNSEAKRNTKTETYTKTSTNTKEEDVSDQEDSDLPPPTPKQFREKWKEEMPSFVPMHITKKRRRKLRARRKESRFVENSETIIEKASQSQFLIENTSNGSGERTFFDATWLLENDENYTKVLEGKYDDQGQDVEEFGHLDADYSGERREKVKEAMDG